MRVLFDDLIADMKKDKLLNVAAAVSYLFFMIGAVWSIFFFSTNELVEIIGMLGFLGLGGTLIAGAVLKKDHLFVWIVLMIVSALSLGFLSLAFRG